jgi:hypothetical protein
MTKKDRTCYCVANKTKIMSAINKPAQIRIYISESDEKFLNELGKDVLSITAVASYVLKAALQCLKDNPGKIPFPPEFRPK